MATILMPKYYPFSGTRLITVLSITGHDTSEIANFQVDFERKYANGCNIS